MDKRTFLKMSGALAAGALITPAWNCSAESGSTSPNEPENQALGDGFELPDLPYGTNALAPYIDEKTMEIHHGKHHAGYVRKLNAALEEGGKKAGNIVKLLGKVDKSMPAIRNNGGGHFNHSLFWKVMVPNGGGKPSGDLGDAINGEFGSFDQFKATFSEAAKTRFGSGWAWLSVDKNKRLFVSSTPNQDNPLMSKVVDQPGTPILGIDVWEHAYYLNYQNRRPDYVEAFFNVINWDQVSSNFGKATG